jgi:hypothetical protein
MIMNWSLDYAGIAALIIALVTLAKTFISSKSDVAKEKLDLVTRYQELADKSATRSVDLLTRVTYLESEFIVMKADLRTFYYLHMEWSDGISVLLEQIEKANGAPLWEPDLRPLEKLREKYSSDVPTRPRKQQD